MAALGPPVVTQALVHAASVLTLRDQASERVLSVDMRPLVIHLLAGLEQAGIKRAVVTLGERATEVAACVTDYRFTRLRIDFVYLTLGQALGHVGSIANSVIATRSAFTGGAPLLIVRADNLYDPRLLRKIADAPFGAQQRPFEAFALVDATPATLNWAAAARNNWTKVVRDKSHTVVVRLGSRLGSFDAVVAGEVYAVSPKIFDVLAQHFGSSLVDAMAALADQGQLSVVEVGELTRHYFTPRTLAGVFQPEVQASKWAALNEAARELLYSGEWRPTSNMPTPPLRGELEKRTEPLLRLGPTLGEGGFGEVVEAEPGPKAPVEAGSSRLAVKMFKSKGEDDRARMDAIMWEVFVLKKLNHHPNIVRLIDVVELADSVVYVVMARIEGPVLVDYIYSQPDGRLAEPTARTLFRHILSALRHAHSRGLLHCDVKPANVRLHADADGAGQMVAVLVDWGLARQIDSQPACVTEGTMAYASPEQLTGYDADSAWGRAKLGPPADVWALGATLYEMLVGRVPFDGESHVELVQNVMALNYDTRPEAMSYAARQLIDSMLQTQPSNRASISDLYLDAWTTAGEPMPSDVDSVNIDVGACTKQSSSNWRCIALYLCYAALLCVALCYGLPELGSPLDLAEEVLPLEP